MDNRANTQEYVSAKTMAYRYGLSESMIRKLLRRPDCPEVRFLHSRMLIPLEAFDRFMDGVIEADTAYHTENLSANYVHR